LTTLLEQQCVAREILFALDEQMISGDARCLYSAA
jgi:hypothetical protein